MKKHVYWTSLWDERGMSKNMKIKYKKKQGRICYIFIGKGSVKYLPSQQLRHSMQQTLESPANETENRE